MLEHVKKRDGSIVAYQREHIYYAIKKAAASIDELLQDEQLEQLTCKVEDCFVPYRKRLVSADKISEAITKVLKKEAPVVERAYRKHSEEKQRRRRSLQVRREKIRHSSTDKALLVQPISKDERQPWHRGKLYESLRVDYGLTPQVASQVSTSVEKKLLNLGAPIVSSSLIRALVKDELVEREIKPKKYPQDVIGLPSEDIEQLLEAKVKENANIRTNNPEAVALAIVEQVQKQWALHNIFSSEVAEDHMQGVIHIHDLGYPTRVYCSSHSPEYLKKYGLSIGTVDVLSKPAKHARTLTAHLNTFLSTMQAFYAGALGVGFINIFYAPLLRGMSYDEILQEAQNLIFTASQSAFSRGGQSLFLDYNIHVGIPDWMKDVPAIGAGGQYLKYTYGDFEKEAQDFAHALLDIWAAGDGAGVPFSFPTCRLHVDTTCFTDPQRKKVLEHACQTASKNGSVYFVFDRDAVTLSMCCRLNIKVKDVSVLKRPETTRLCGFQNVTINLPRLAFESKNKEKFFEQLEHAMNIAVKAHQEKKRFIAYLMSAPNMPLWEIGRKSLDGAPYVQLDKAVYIFGLLGLNEAVQILCGKELHEGEQPVVLGLEIVARMKEIANSFSEKMGLQFVLEESPAESATRRLALKDLHDYPEMSKFIRGDIEREAVYYSNSIHLRADAPVDMITRIKTQARFHPLIESGAITHVFCGEKLPSASSIYNLVKKTYQQTETTQLVLSPTFTVCNKCHCVVVGESSTCTKCGSTDTTFLSRIVGYYSRVSSWHDSKQAEFIARQKGNYEV